MTRKKASVPSTAAAPERVAELPPPASLRQPAEVRFARELAALQAADTGPRPPGWMLSPRMVRTFILGSRGEPLAAPAPHNIPISRKFYGDDPLVERAIVTLMSNRGLLLVGEPGTAKSMLSELLAAAISGDSGLTIQGSVGTTEDQIRYSWNYALLVARGPSREALVPGPVYQGMSRGAIVRFEELTRATPEVQDTLIGLLSEQLLQIPELPAPDQRLLARPGFNIVGTANLRDRGTHEMSSALKRRFNFETVHPIRNPRLELELVQQQAADLLRNAGANIELPIPVTELLITVFSDLRTGRTVEGTTVERPTSVLSTAEAVSTVYAAALQANYFGEGQLRPGHLAQQLLGTVFKDVEQDRDKLRQYLHTVVKGRGREHPEWREFEQLLGLLAND
jgi:MoxR-like ATPase